MTSNALVHIAMLPKILKAATLLSQCGLIDAPPSFYVKRYVGAHPEINAALNRVQLEQP